MLLKPSWWLFLAIPKILFPWGITFSCAKIFQQKISRKWVSPNFRNNMFFCFFFYVFFITFFPSQISMACSLERPGVGAEPWGAAMDPASTGGAPDQRSWEILSIKHGDFAIYYNTIYFAYIGNIWNIMTHSLAYIGHIITIYEELWQGIYGIYNDNIWQYLEDYMRFGPQIWDVPSSTVGPSQECLPKKTCEDDSFFSSVDPG